MKPPKGRDIRPDKSLVEMARNLAVFRDDHRSVARLSAWLESVDSKLAALDRILETSERRQQATRFVVRCPQGHALGIVYACTAEEELVFVSRMQIVWTHGFDTDAVVEFVDFLDIHDTVLAICRPGLDEPPLQAHCKCQFQRKIPRRWLYDRMGAAESGAVFTDDHDSAGDYDYEDAARHSEMLRSWMTARIGSDRPHVAPAPQQQVE
jgi:hypothetical protein